MEYDYENRISQSMLTAKELEGANLHQIVVNIVADEFNVVYLVTDKGCFAIQPDIGGEIVKVVRADVPNLENAPENPKFVCPPRFEEFLGKKIAQVRRIGEAWNGSGIELSFFNVFEKTIVIQSIDAGEVPEGFSDCLRLGVCSYQYKWTAI